MAKSKNQKQPTGSFSTMGTSVAVSIGASQSAKPQRGIVRPKNDSKGGMLEAATASHRAGIQERLGFKGAPQTTLYAQNAAEAGLTQRNVVTVPSAIGNRDFYLRRQYGQGT